MAEPGAIVSTTLLEVLIFSGDKETREYDGRKHIGAADLLREMARRKAANPAWNNEATIGHCVRSFRNDVAVWREEAVRSDNSPKMLKEITANWKEFEIIFRRAWKIKATMTSVAWMENNRQKANESITAFVTRVQNAVATTSREALTNKANNIKEKDEPKWNDHTEKYLAAQAVYDARAVATPWTPAEKEAIDARNREFGQEQQEAARYECRRTMTNIITFEIVRQGLTNPLMRKEADKVAGECISTDSFKEKLTQIVEVNQAKPKQAPLHSRSEYINEVGDESNMEEDRVNAVGKGKEKKKGKGKANNGHANAVDKPPPTQRRPGAAGTRGAAGTMQLVQETGTHLQTMLGQRSNPEATIPSSQECRQRTRTRQHTGWTENQQQRERPEPAKRECQRMLLRQLYRQQLQQQQSCMCKRTSEEFCKRRMVLVF
jgi:hypothetical protein